MTQPKDNVILAVYNCNGLKTPSTSAGFRKSIAHRKLDVLCLTEPRLNTFNVQQILVSIAPRGNIALHSPRPNNATHLSGGGLCVLCRAALNPSATTDSRSFDV